MKKRLHMILLFAVLLVCFTGCSLSDDSLAFDVDEREMAELTQTIAMTYFDVSDTEKDYYLSDGTEVQKTAVSGFEAIQTTDHVGDFISLSNLDDNVVIENGANGKVNCSIILRYENRNVEFMVSYSENKGYEMKRDEILEYYEEVAYSNYGSTLEDIVTQIGYSSVDDFLEQVLAEEEVYRYTPEACEVSAIYTKGELLGQAAEHTAIGMVTVFAVLIFISFVIGLLKYVPMLFDPKARAEHKAKKEAERAAKAAEEASDEEEGGSDTAEKSTAPVIAAADDGELIAVIAAALAAASAERGPAYTASNDKLVVRSIRKIR